MGLFKKLMDALESTDDQSAASDEFDPRESDILLDPELLEGKVNVERRAEIINTHYDDVTSEEAQLISDVLKTYSETYELQKHEAKKKIQEETRLSRDRVTTIFWTERASIQFCDAIRKYQQQDVVTKVEWMVTEDSSPICRETADEIEERGEAVPAEELQSILREKARKYKDEGGTPERMDHWVPHKKCNCSVSPVVD